MAYGDTSVERVVYAAVHTAPSPDSDHRQGQRDGATGADRCGEWDA